MLHAPTGSGKTTRVPWALVQAGLAGDARALVTEPRRMAATETARWVARQVGGRPGDPVGWRVRDDVRAGPETRLEYVTTGVARRMLVADPFLEDVGLLVLDEFHERTLDVDVLAAAARQLVHEVRDDLRVLVMSATLDAEPVADWLGGPVVRSEGRTYPVEVRHVRRPDPRPVVPRVVDAVTHELEAGAGDLLAFVPGAGEVRGVCDALEPTARAHDLELVGLWGGRVAALPEGALQPGPKRRVVVATNVAETSLTIDGIEVVVDSGLARVPVLDAQTGLTHLELRPIARAAADQRAGRAGRTRPGRALRLWTESDHRRRADRELPGVHRDDLSATLLLLEALGEPDPLAFPWLEPPRPDRVGAARHLLTELGCLDHHGLTDRGRRVLALPVEPRLAVFLLEMARRGRVDDGIRLALWLDALRGAPGLPGGRPDTPSDLLDVLQGEHAAPPSRRCDRLRRALDRSGWARGAPVGRTEAIGRAALAAWPDRVTLQRSGDPHRGRMRGGRGVRRGGSTAVRKAEAWVSVGVHVPSSTTGRGTGGAGRDGDADVTLATAIDVAWLRSVDEEVLRWDATAQRVVARSIRRWHDLVLDEHPAPVRDAEAASQVLVDAIAPDAERWLGLSKAAGHALWWRLRFLHRFGAAEGLPEPSAWLRDIVLPDLARGISSLSELGGRDVSAALQSRLTWDQRQRIETLAPERVEVPSGRAIPLDYRPESGPVLAVRLQEAFGLEHTPRVAGGRHEVVVHLLAPNNRPAQITTDLAGFWTGSWAEVRKELRARYPKHAWPEHPTAADAQRRPRRRR